MKPRDLLAFAAALLILTLALALVGLVLFEVVTHTEFGW
jgi:hypothetical protein